MKADAPATTLLSGKTLAVEVLDGLRQQVEILGLEDPPHLVVVRVSGDPASSHYVGAIQRAARRSGIAVSLEELPPGCSFRVFADAAARAGSDPRVDGVQVQKPVPEGRHTSEVVELVPPSKDVEGMHPENQGLLLLGRPRFVPCTPSAVLRLLEHYRIPLEGRRAVVLGRSDIVGKPLATLLLARNATVTVCHTQTRQLAREVSQAEILVAALGKPGLVSAYWIAPGAVVVDVGHHVLEDGRVVGDVAAGAVERASAITPIPGGVGPLTVTELLANVVSAAARRA